MTAPMTEIIEEMQRRATVCETVARDKTQESLTGASSEKEENVQAAKEWMLQAKVWREAGDVVRGTDAASPSDTAGDRAGELLARLEIGFRTDSARLKELETTLAETLQNARQFGQRHGPPDDWNTHWQQQWDTVEAILGRIRERVLEMERSMEGSDAGDLQRALSAWELIQAEDAKLVRALTEMRAHAIGLDAAVRKDWNLLAQTLESHWETIHACAQALRIKLELLQRHSRQDVDQLVRDILAKLPGRTTGNEATPERQTYRDAAAELETEHHQFLGFVDVVKSLFMWVESPEERARKNRSLQLHEP